MSNKAISGILGVAFVATIAIVVWAFMEPVHGAIYQETSKIANATVNVNISCAFDSEFADGIEFGANDPGTNDVSETANGYNVTAGSQNNVNITVWIRANGDMTKGADATKYIKIDSNMTWDDSTTYGSYTPDTNAMTTTYAQFSNIPVNGLEPGNKHHFQIWLDFPNVEPGTYNNTIYVKCNESA